MLKNLYMESFWLIYVFQKKQPYRPSMKEATSSHEHLNLINGIISQYLTIGIKVSEEDKQKYLLAFFATLIWASCNNFNL